MRIITLNTNGILDIHPHLKQGDSLVQPSMPEGDDSENRLTSRHLSYPDGRRYAATAHPTEKIIMMNKQRQEHPYIPHLKERALRTLW